MCTAMQIKGVYSLYLLKVLAYKSGEIKDLCIFAQIFEKD